MVQTAHFAVAQLAYEDGPGEEIIPRQATAGPLLRP